MGVLRRIKTLISRGTVIICSITVVSYMLLYQLETVYLLLPGRSSNVTVKGVYKSYLNIETPVKPRRPYDVLINSYMRSGSSFTGQLLAFRPDTFYWYEPLWNYNSGVYYWGPDKICYGNGGCSQVHPTSTLNAKKMQGVLENIYNCNFSSLAPAVAEIMTSSPVYSGDSWAPYKKCRMSVPGQVSKCLKTMEDVCIKSKHRATKVVRMTVDNLEAVLEKVPDLKAIHLFRDPRAIINSRIATTWYTLNEPDKGGAPLLKRDADDLCRRMTYDLNASAILKKKYPDRFALVMFEDMQNGLEEKASLLYNYLGIETESLHGKLGNMSAILKEEHTVSNASDFANWWRYQLSYSAIEIVQETCRSIMKTIGYRLFTSQEESHDMSIKSFHFNDSLLIKNINTVISYNPS